LILSAEIKTLLYTIKTLIQAWNTKQLQTCMYIYSLRPGKNKHSPPLLML
jgi:hypothetical protein